MKDIAVIIDNTPHTGPEEPGVQLQTHFLAPSFGEDHLFHAKFG